MRVTIGALLLAVALLPAAGTAHTDLSKECNGTIERVGMGDITVLYVDDRDIIGDGIYVYAESNGHFGLQSGAQHPVFGDLGDATFWRDPCDNSHGSYGFDTLVF